MAAEEIRIPTSPYQRARFAELNAELRAVQMRTNEYATAIIAGAHDPATILQWRLDGDALVCVPIEVTS